MDSLYAADRKVKFDDLFASPGALYRDTPFWAWNCKLEPEELKRQIRIFKQMGMGGFHMHARTGLDTPYLSPEFMNCVKECVRTAKDLDMLAWLYDEDRWPSGAAGGFVTRNPEFRARHLLFTPNRGQRPRTRKTTTPAGFSPPGRFDSTTPARSQTITASARMRIPPGSGEILRLFDCS